MSLYTISSEAWENIGREPKKRGRDKYTHKERQLLKDAIIDVVCDEGNSHCYLTSRRYTGGQLQKWSEDINGFVFSFIDHFVHCSGSTSETYIHKDKWATFNSSRKAVQEVTGYDFVGWAPTQQARWVNKWLREQEISGRPIDETSKYQLLPHYQFNACHPCKMEYAYYLDMKAAHWNLVRRAPSPLIRFNPDKPRYLSWRSLSSSQMDSWENMLDKLAPHKTARNAIIGNWTAGHDKDKVRKNCYHKGKVWPHTVTLPTNLSTFGLYIVRLCYEICQEEYLQSQAVRAWSDCVITHRPKADYWDHVGIEYETKHEGPLELRNYRIYKIGGHETPYWHMTMVPDENHIMTGTPRVKGDKRAIITPPEPSETIPHLLDRSMYLHPRTLRVWKQPLSSLPIEPQEGRLFKVD
ncbi:MAG: hypothetical protein ACJ8BW_00895 [Ktedonobacteraceae bacterium]